MLSQSRQPDTNGGQNKHRKQIACQHSGGNHQPWPKRLSASTPLANPIRAKPTLEKMQQSNRTLRR
ncbi:hypothetical protein HY25_002376 [Salmonella enterica subsp. enterica]|nr:hypothetical protein [Salmonella enterica subsp. enterica]